LAKDIIVPVPDQTTEEVRIVGWKVVVGDTVNKGDILLEIETDKSIMDVEANEAGTILEIVAEVDDMVPVSATIGQIGKSGEAFTPTVTGDTAGAQSAVSVAPAPATVSAPVNIDTAPVVDVASANQVVVAATPVALSLAKKHGVNLNDVQGSGRNGMITKCDVEKIVGVEVVVSQSEAPVAQVESTAPMPADVSEVIVPVPDQTTEEVRIVGWKKDIGEQVTKGDILLEIETDKSIMDVEAIADGVLLVTFAETDDMVPVSQLIGYLGPKGSDVSRLASGGNSAMANSVTKTVPPAVAPQPAMPSPPPVVMSSPVAAQPMHTQNNGGRLFISPNARRLAAKLSVDYTQVQPTGANGRIVGADIEAYAASGQGRTAVATPKRPLGVAAPGQPVPGSVVPMTKMRQAISKNLVASSRDIPSFNVTMSIDMTRGMDVRKQLNAGRDKATKLSVNDLIVRGCALALREYPSVNSQISGDNIQYMPNVNIGIAIALESGLVVPVLLDADQQNWQALPVATKDMATQARNGKLVNPGKGTFTISNLGMFGVDHFSAIINPPESAIIAVGRIKEEVVAANGMFGLKPMLQVTLCSDHRTVDGALAAQFLLSIKRYLEEDISING